MSLFNPRRFAAHAVSRRRCRSCAIRPDLLIAFVLPLLLLFMFGYAVILDTARTRIGLAMLEQQRRRAQPGTAPFRVRTGSK